MTGHKKLGYRVHEKIELGSIEKISAAILGHDAGLPKNPAIAQMKRIRRLSMLGWSKAAGEFPCAIYKSPQRIACRGLLTFV